MNHPEIKYLTDATGHPTAVVIPIELWRQLLPQDENAIADLANRLDPNPSLSHFNSDLIVDIRDLDV